MMEPAVGVWNCFACTKAVFRTNGSDVVYCHAYAGVGELGRGRGAGGGGGRARPSLPLDPAHFLLPLAFPRPVVLLHVPVLARLPVRRHASRRARRAAWDANNQRTTT